MCGRVCVVKRETEPREAPTQTTKETHMPPDMPNGGGWLCAPVEGKRDARHTVEQESVKQGEADRHILKP